MDYLVSLFVLSCADFEHMKFFYFVQKLQIYSWECGGNDTFLHCFLFGNVIASIASLCVTIQ